MWDLRSIASTIRSGLQAREAELRAEQSVLGLDALEELELHPLIADSLRADGYGAWREHPYPGRVGVKGRRALPRERERCDVVLTLDPARAPADPLDRLKELDSAEGTLFERDVEQAVDPRTPTAECCWLEIKVVGQFAFRAGIPGPNTTYSSQLTSAVSKDLRKLNADGGIATGGLVLVLFTDSRETGEHDLTLACHRALDRHAEFRPPMVEGFEIQDRIGNRWCAVILLPK